MNIICFGQMNWDWCWTGKQHFMSRLAQRGHRVLYIDPQWDTKPKGFLNTIKTLFPVWSKAGLREIDHSLFIYTYPYCPLLRWRLCNYRYPLVLKNLIHNLGFNDPVVMTMLPQSQPIIEALNFEKIVYYAIDEMTAFGGTLAEDKVRIRQQEEKLVKKSTMVLAVSLRLLNRIKNLHPNTHLLPNAVDPHHYSPLRLERLSPHPCLPSKTGPFITFIGQLDERMDQSIVRKMAGSHPDWTIILAGRIKDGVDFSFLKKFSNIIFTGYLHYSELPSILKQTDVCIIPYHRDELTLSSSPVKAYEYLASGRPVVSTLLDGLAECRDVIKMATTHEEFLALVESALKDDTEDERLKRLAKAKENSWEERTDFLETLLIETFERKSSKKNRRTSGLFKPFKIMPHELNIIHDKSSHPSLKLKIFLVLTVWLGKLYFAIRVFLRALTGRRPLLIRKIIIARKGLLGDMVLFLPTLKALRYLFPKSKITLAIETPDHVMDLIKHNPNIDELLIMNFYEKSIRHKILHGLKLFLSGYDLSITGATYFLKSEVFFTGAPFRTGINDGHPMQQFINLDIPLDPSLNESDNNIKLIELLGGTIDKISKTPRICLDDKKTTACTKMLLKGLGVCRANPLIIVHPGCQKQTRQWPLDKFAELCIRLLKKKQDLIIAFTGILPEYQVIQNIIEQIPHGFRKRVHNIAGKTDIFSLIGVMKRCSLFISNDTGVMHLARSCGAPLIALLGPENDSRWGPYPLGYGPARAIRYSVPCAPCVKKTCSMNFCMKSLPVDDVFNTALRYLKKDFGEPSGNGLYKLEKTVTRYAWEDLPAIGLTPPSVTIVIHRFPDDHLKLVSNQNELCRLLDLVQSQSYPNVSVVVCNPPRYVKRPDINVTMTFLNAVYPDNASLWRAILRTTSSEFITSLIPGENWAIHKIAHDVAVLIRNPQANLAASSPFTNTKPFYNLPKTFIPGKTTIRRSFLEEQLAKVTKDSSIMDYQLWKREPVYLGRSMYVKL
ncbi:MAG: glycosyltransferase family 9 protein [Candidatus Omnitrophota bacterium]